MRTKHLYHQELQGLGKMKDNVSGMMTKGIILDFNLRIKMLLKTICSSQGGITAVRLGKQEIYHNLRQHETRTNLSVGHPFKGLGAVSQYNITVIKLNTWL